MPITQDRMIALINAAVDYQSALQRLQQALVTNLRAVKRGEQSPSEMIAELEVYTNPLMLLSFPMESPVTIAVEAKHFDREFSRNLNAARRKEAARRELGVQPLQRHAVLLATGPTVDTRQINRLWNRQRIDLQEEINRIEQHEAEQMQRSKRLGRESDYHNQREITAQRQREDQQRQQELRDRALHELSLDLSKPLQDQLDAEDPEAFGEPTFGTPESSTAQSPKPRLTPGTLTPEQRAEIDKELMEQQDE